MEHKKVLIAEDDKDITEILSLYLEKNNFEIYIADNGKKALNIVQTNLFGNSILDTMYNQIEFLRDKQILEIKEKINKIPNKVSIISVLFIVPLILLLLLGPFIIEFMG